MSYRGFAERVALVVGGAGGVGRAAALQLALQGAFVIVSYAPGDEDGRRVAEELRELGTLAHAVEGEVTRAQGAGGVMAFVAEAFGRLDLMVYAGGAGPARETAGDAEEVWDRVLGRSLKGAFLCARAAAPLMRNRPSPAVVNVVSGIGAGGGAAAAAASAGLVGLTKATARELAPHVRVNCVVAGVVDSGDVLDRVAAPPPQEAGGAAPARPLAPDEVARACVYLLSPDAGSVTGQALFVGGRHSVE